MRSHLHAAAPACWQRPHRLRGLLSVVAAPQLHGPRASLACRSSSALVDMASRLAQSEEDRDWAAALEVLTEARVLKLQLSPESCEVAVRVLAASGQQWKRAADVFEGMIDRGVRPSEPTSAALFQALVQGRQGDRAYALLQKLEVVASDASTADALHSPSSLSRCYNLTVRAMVKQGNTEASVQLLEKMVASSGRLQAEEGTFTAVASELLRVGEDARAEEVLEMRDYL